MNKPALRIDADDFELFGLPRRFALDRAEVDARWKALQAEVHPDRHAAAGAAAQRVALQWATRVNEAHRRLRDPLQRAAELCELLGAPVDAQRNTAMPASFLMQQMAWREALDEAGDPAAVEALVDEVHAERRARFAALEEALDTRADGPAAAAELRALMFIERFGEELERRLDALGQ
ncbi:Fe-S protein assembly co-chaperone HscB [Caldimonas sp. KR1-144]|uniref:Fe-S protein assembly co-chaperone HscB n=1 Tax=Caldimonas sp. KR1-144 TaxID=3400911 RepID=UPI003C03AD11